MSKFLSSDDSKISLAAGLVGLISALPVLLLLPSIYNPNSLPNDPGSLAFIFFYYTIIGSLELALALIGGIILGFALKHYKSQHPWLIAFIGCAISSLFGLTVQLSLYVAAYRVILFIAVILIAHHLFSRAKAPITNLNSSPDQNQFDDHVNPTQTTTYALPTLSQSLFLAAIIGAITACSLSLPLISLLAFPITLALIYQILNRQHTPHPGPTTLLAIILLLLVFIYLKDDSLSLLFGGFTNQHPPIIAFMLLIAVPVVAQLITYIPGQTDRKTHHSISQKSALAVLDDKLNLCLFIIGFFGLALALVLSWAHYY